MGKFLPQILDAKIVSQIIHASQALLEKEEK